MICTKCKKDVAVYVIRIVEEIETAAGKSCKRSRRAFFCAACATAAEDAGPFPVASVIRL